jgi:hypothetical protein
MNSGHSLLLCCWSKKYLPKDNKQYSPPRRQQSWFRLFANKFLSVVCQQQKIVIFGIWTRDQNLACNHRITPPPPRHLHQRPLILYTILPAGALCELPHLFGGNSIQTPEWFVVYMHAQDLTLVIWPSQLHVHINLSITSILPKTWQDINRSLGPHCRLQLATVYKKVYFGVKTIALPPSKPTIVFSLNEGDDKITLLDVF